MPSMTTMSRSMATGLYGQLLPRIALSGARQLTGLNSKRDGKPHSLDQGYPEFSPAPFFIHSVQSIHRDPGP